MGSVRVKVIYFAQAREFAGTNEDTFELPSPVSVEHLFHEVLTAHPRLASLKRTIQSLVNGRAVSEKTELKDGDRVALLPPVAGG
jgi:molybdopterin converting factor subunit 1